VRFRILIIAVIAFASAPCTFAATVYRCVGIDEVPVFSETKVSGLQCKPVAETKVFDHAKTSITAPNLPVPEKVEQTQKTAAASSTVNSKASDNEITFLRMGYSTTYTWLDANEVRHFASSKPRGVANVQTKRTEYPIFSIPSCYACKINASVNFGNVKLNLQAFANEIRRSAQKYGVEEAIVRAIIHAESAYRPHVISPKNAQGLMQLIPATAKRFGVRDAFDPAQNIEGGVQYLAFLLKRYNNDLSLTAAAYNAGEGAVARYKGIPPYKETKNYVVRVGQLADRYRKALKSG
jgi:soluble lytic murein transglycosylase-like protein